MGKRTRFVPSLFDNPRKLRSLTTREENKQPSLFCLVKMFETKSRPMTSLTSTGIFLWLFLVLPQFACKNSELVEFSFQEMKLYGTNPHQIRHAAPEARS